jgi:hypothetical protein
MTNTLHITLSHEAGYQTLGEHLATIDDLKTYDAVTIFCDLYPGRSPDDYYMKEFYPNDYPDDTHEIKSYKPPELVLTGIEQLAHITSLELSWRAPIESLDILSPLVNLRRLLLNQTDELLNIDALALMPGLTTLLVIHGESLSSNFYHSLPKLRSLKSLYFEDIDSLTDLSFIAEMPNLDALSIIGCISALSQVEAAQVMNIKALDFYPSNNTVEGNDNSRLSNFNALEWLNVDFWFGEFDLSFISGCEKLKHLSVRSKEPIRNLRLLNRMTALESVKLSDCLGKIDREGYKKEIVAAHPSIEFEFVH